MAAPQDAWAKPIAKLANSTFLVPSLKYVRVSRSYDPAVGDVTETETEFSNCGAVTKSGRTEAGGTAETYYLEVWLATESIGEEFPTTGDHLLYQGKKWKCSSIDPQYSGDVKYACKVTAHTS